MATEKPCEGCRWNLGGWMCKRSYEGPKPQPLYVPAAENRADTFNVYNCGPDGRYWEPKESEADNG